MNLIFVMILCYYIFPTRWHSPSVWITITEFKTVCNCFYFYFRLLFIIPRNSNSFFCHIFGIFISVSALSLFYRYYHCMCSDGVISIIPPQYALRIARDLQNSDIFSGLNWKSAEPLNSPILYVCPHDFKELEFSSELYIYRH